VIQKVQLFFNILPNAASAITYGLRQYAHFNNNLQLPRHYVPFCLSHILVYLFT